MPCHPYREAISARLDGEPLGMPARALEDHLGSCPACTDWAERAARATRRARLAPAPPVPDLTGAVLAALPRELPGAAAAARTRLVDTALRFVLLAIGVAQAGIAWPVLVTGAGAMSAPEHMAHETGAWNLAVAAALLAVAAAPRLAAGALTALGSLAVLLVPVTLADLGAGHVHLDRAVAHLLLLAGAVLVAAVAWRDSRRRLPIARARPAGARVSGRTTAPRRRAAALLVLLVGWLLAALVSAGPAAAHATLISTDPAEGARLDAAPDEVTLQFSEGVSLGAGYARVLTAAGDEVDGGEPSVEGRELRVPLPVDLGDGGYLVTYRVVSADSHPISGAFSFVVGEGELLPAGTAAAADDADPVVAALLPVLRAIGFAGIALAVGVPVLALLCWPAAWGSPRLRRLAVGGALAVVVTAVLTFLLQGPYAAGSGVGTAFEGSLLSATASSRTGWALLARVALASALAAALAPAWRSGSAPERPALAGAAVFATGLVVATAATGHPVAGSWPLLAVAVAAVHVAAMAVWLGGLAGLLVGLVRPGPDAADVAEAMPRFSRIAFGAVAALVVSGIVQAVREVGSPTALLDTTYGGVLLAKVALVLVVLGAAGVSRVWVQQRLGVRPTRAASGHRVTAHAFTAPGGGGPDGGLDDEDGSGATRGRVQQENAVDHLPSLRRSMLVEVSVAVVVLVLSGVLVGTPPARSAVADPVDVTLPLQGTGGEAGSVQVSVDPAQPGANVLHVYLLDADGRATQPAGIEVSLTEEDQGIGPLDVEIAGAGPGHYTADSLTIPGAGTWTLTVTLRLDEFTATRASTEFPVR